MTGLQDVVQEYLKAPPANTLPPPPFVSTSSIHLEEGMRQMSEVVTGMLDQALSAQEPQEDPVRNTWKGLKKGETAISDAPWTEYWFNGEVHFGHPDIPTL